MELSNDELIKILSWGISYIGEYGIEEAKEDGSVKIHMKIQEILIKRGDK